MSNLLKPKVPKPKDPVRVPTPDDPDIKANATAKRREEERNRRGRKSTDLSGTSYSRTTLG